LSSEDWLSKIKQEKQKEDDIKAEVEADKKAWEEHREKHKDEAKRIIELLNSELRKVAEVYTDSSMRDMDKPKVEGNDQYVQLSIPIVRTGLYQGYSISFSLKLTEKGYGLNIFGGSSSFIPPPVTLEEIQKEAIYFLQRRSEEVARMAGQEKRFHKQMG
jgi:hypothetical protein